MLDFVQNLIDLLNHTLFREKITRKKLIFEDFAPKTEHYDKQILKDAPNVMIHAMIL